MGWEKKKERDMDGVRVRESERERERPTPHTQTHTHTDTHRHTQIGGKQLRPKIRDPTYGLITVDGGELDVGRVGHVETSPKFSRTNSGARSHAHDGIECDGPRNLGKGKKVFL